MPPRVRLPVERPASAGDWDVLHEPGVSRTPAHVGRPALLTEERRDATGQCVSQSRFVSSPRGWR